MEDSKVNSEVGEERKPKKKQSESSAEPQKYKKNLYLPNGQIRHEISKAVMHTMISRWGDLIHVIPTNQWSSVEEIVQMVWEWEKKQYRKAFTRTRKQIEDGVKELLEAGILVPKA